MKCSYFITYAYCGAHLDPGERCEECSKKSKEEESTNEDTNRRRNDRENR